jgi:arabinose-5-phosphate isomerase
MESISVTKTHAHAPASLATSSSHVTTARRVLGIEQKGLAVLATSLGAEFNEAVECLLSIKGHVVVSGMGKSGHIAGKIAATLASTGTPAFFVHPAEANHGDLGMITPRDAVLMLSESGNSQELAGIVEYTRRHSIPLVAICRDRQSLLGRGATHFLALPLAEPACPLRLAPTTSTTMMLALGDALAVAMLEHTGFTADGFKNFHPGGQLGLRLRRVADVMHKGNAMPLVKADTPMVQVVIEMTASRLGCAGVLSETGQLVGVITDGDLRRNLSRSLTALPAQAIMNHSPKTIPPHVTVQQALDFMHAHAISVVFAVDAAGIPQGVLHLHDCLGGS